MLAVRHYPQLVTPGLRAWLQAFARYDADGRGSVWLATCSKQVKKLPLLLANVANTVAPGLPFSGALLQCYHDGNAVTPCHTDAGGTGFSFILSVGATRTFRIHRGSCVDSLDAMTIECIEGTVIVMDESFQRDWHHQIIPDPNITGEKLSLVFRTNPGG
jgi:alkylated DNA repair dioxygenase AlkB